VADSLKSLPALTHLIINLKNYQEECFIKNELPLLERLNKKPLINNQTKINFLNEPKKLLSIQKIN
jgi:hypothetical protein